MEISNFVERMRTLESAAAPFACSIDPWIDARVAEMEPHTLRAEYIRPRETDAKLLFVATGARMPALGPRDGYERSESAHATRLQRGDETLVAITESYGPSFEWHFVIAPASDAAAHAFVKSLVTLEPYEVVARPGAFVKSFGVERTRDGRVRALVGVHRDLDRIEKEERMLRFRGFRETDDEGLWCLEPNHNLVWMGGTVYGYYGDVPESVGGF